MQHTRLIRSAFGMSLPRLDAAETICAVCGQHVTRSVLASTLIKSNSSDLADTFRGERVCGDCAAVFANSRFTGSFIVADGNGIQPVVSLSSVTPERPAWRDLLRQLPIAAKTVAVITSNTKRRLWPRAVISSYATHWRPLFVDGRTDRLLNIDAWELAECLNLVEEVYSMGFPKAVIADSLYRAGKHALDFTALRQYETALHAWRDSDEFILSLFIAQKEG